MNTTESLPAAGRGPVLFANSLTMLIYLFAILFSLMGLLTPTISGVHAQIVPITAAAQSIPLQQQILIPVVPAPAVQEITVTAPQVVVTHSVPIKTTPAEQPRPKVAARPNPAHAPTPAPAQKIVTIAPPPVPTPQPQPAPSQSPAPTPAPAPTTVAPAAGIASEIALFVLQLTNEQRAQNGLTTLTSNDTLASVARVHSTDMLANYYFEHTDLAGCDPGCRITRAGYAWQTYGENIHWMSGFDLSARDSAQKIVTDWMNSAGHRANILNGNFTQAGVGIVVQGTKIYSTTDYAHPRQ